MMNQLIDAVRQALPDADIEDYTTSVSFVRNGYSASVDTDGTTFTVSTVLCEYVHDDFTIHDENTTQDWAEAADWVVYELTRGDGAVHHTMPPWTPQQP